MEKKLGISNIKDIQVIHNKKYFKYNGDNGCTATFDEEAIFLCENTN